ncbi:MAG: type I restriction enzyme HsdR N-terminal domain-containing protein [Bacteroidales bacterium]|nr:type I restriction enzyme HsdR N-terminal domain-containing protein [Bacteroidales bacterium]
MQSLDFPDFQFRISSQDDRQMIWDPIRRKMVRLTPEEWVRQHVIAYLTGIKGFPIGLLGVEKKIVLNGLVKRFDLVAFNNSGTPIVLIECKAPSVLITQKTFDQAARYNMQLNAGIFYITNGLNHYCCFLDPTANTYQFLEEIPSYSELIISLI